MIRFAIPNQGGVHGLAKCVLQRMGLLPDDEGLQYKLSFETPDPDVRIVLRRGERDIPLSLAYNDVQLAAVGSDYVLETAPRHLVQICDLGWGAGHLCLLARREDGIQSRYDLRPGDKIFSQYPNYSRDLVVQSGLEGVYVDEIRGAAEGFFDDRPDLRAIVDIFATGNSARANDLKVVEWLHPTSVGLFTNPESRLHPKVLELARQFKQVADALNKETLADVLWSNASQGVNPRQRSAIKSGGPGCPAKTERSGAMSARR